jgi:alanyl aminopeptidase
MRHRLERCALLCTVGSLITGCVALLGAEPVPTGRLPTDVRPLHYALELELVPSRDRYSGSVAIAIELDRPRSTIWLHARELEVERATLVLDSGERVDARFEMVHESGVAALRLSRDVGPGRASIELSWTAAFGAGLRGLYRISQGTDRYAFTQFEPLSARSAFPCFDEPAFKTPFDVRLRADSAHVALANTPEIERRELEEGLSLHVYATSPPLPTYLIAFAVGPLDVVDAPPVPPNEIRARPLALRGVAPRGRGPELAYALERTGALLAGLERYFGSPYPFAKLDIVAVPDFAAGAMENVGLVTFRDWLLLVDPETSPVYQQRAFASVMTHELAHMWFGNLVTMPWWDDIWLNEAFATWLAARIVAEVHPEHRSELGQLRAAQEAMGADSLVSARRIRQPIESNHDIRNAFDSITYRKGAAVLATFESWLGRERFRAVVRSTVESHRFASAGAEDFLEALAAEGGDELATAFRSFLAQPGLPYVELQPECREGRPVVRLAQSRYLPLGSPGAGSGGLQAATWGLPICLRLGGLETDERHCLLLDAGEATHELPGGCGGWLFPNADAAGYFRWSLPGPAMRALFDEAWPALTTRERIATADALGAAFASGSMETEVIFAAIGVLAGDAERSVATAPLDLLDFAWNHLARTPRERAAVEAHARRLYAARASELGFAQREDDDGETRLLRGELVDFAVQRGREPRLRAEALRRGLRYLGIDGDGGSDGELHPGAAAPELLGTIARVAVEAGGEPAFQAARRNLFASEDATVRGILLGALAHVTDPALADRALALSFDPRLRANEMLTVLRAQVSLPGRRAQAWTWMTSHYDELLERLTPARGARLLAATRGRCSESEAREVEAWFGPRAEALEGGPRRLASALENIQLCAARAAHHREPARRFFDAVGEPGGAR